MIDSLEGEIEPRGSQIRVRLRWCSGIYVVDAFKATFDLAAGVAAALFRVREFLPKEFHNDPQIQREVFDPLEEIWRERERWMRGLGEIGPSPRGRGTARREP
jgi:hypothetical protein